MNKKSPHAVRFFVLSLAILLICSIFIWGFQSNWGQVRIQRLYLTGEDGSSISTLIYIPDNATDETPAPVAVILHGRSNHAHSNDTWSMELARRGYVVLSPDLQGGGESDPSIPRGSQAVTVTEYANSLSYVLHDQINLVGYSMGTQTCLEVYRAVPDMIYSVCEVFGPFMVEKAGGFADVDAHFSIIKSTADQYDYFFVGDPDACTDLVSEMSGLGLKVEPGQDYDRNGKVFRYSEIGGTLHQTGNISGATIQEIVDFEMTVNDSPIEIPASDTMWIPHQLFSGIACVDMLFLLAATINLLMQLSFFKRASNPVTLREPQRGAKT